MTQRQSAGRHEGAPGPEGYPLIGAMPLLRKDPLHFLLEAVRRHGDVVSLGGFPWQKYYFINNPLDIESIFKERHKGYVRGANFQLMRDLAGSGVFLAEGDAWRRQRKLMQPSFHMQHLTRMVDTMNGVAADMVKKWRQVARDGQAIDIERDLAHLALDIAVKTLFGTEVAEHAAAVRRSVQVALGHLYDRVWSLYNLPTFIPTPANRRYRQAVATINSVVYEIIAGRRQSGELGGDVLSMLLGVQDEETGEGMTDRQIRDEVVTLMVAGHETTALAMSWTLHLVSQHPEIERRLHEEIDAVLEGRQPTLADLPRLQYLNMVFKESLRLYPPFWMYTRSPLEDTAIGGHSIAAGSILVFSPYVTHRHPGYWKNPEAMDPERFTPESSAHRPLFAYFPFGHGPRQCIGQRMAELECLLTLATVLANLSPHRVPGRRVEPDPGISLRPKHGIWMTLHERDQRIREAA